MRIYVQILFSLERVKPTHTQLKVRSAIWLLVSELYFSRERWVSPLCKCIPLCVSEGLEAELDQLRRVVSKREPETQRLWVSRPSLLSLASGCLTPFLRTLIGEVKRALGTASSSSLTKQWLLDGKGEGVWFPKWGHHWIRNFLSPRPHKQS